MLPYQVRVDEAVAATVQREAQRHAALVVPEAHAVEDACLHQALRGSPMAHSSNIAHNGQWHAMGKR
jgi:hypothetical protein